MLTDAAGLRGRGGRGREAGRAGDRAGEPAPGAGARGRALVRRAARDDGRGHRAPTARPRWRPSPARSGRRWASAAVNIGTTGVEGVVSAPLGAHHARADHAARAAGRAGRRRRDACGDGGLDPRARPAPAGRRAAGGGGLHQLHPRSSRLSRHDSRRTSPPSWRCSTRVLPRGRRGGGQPRRPAGAGGRRHRRRRAGSGLIYGGPRPRTARCGCSRSGSTPPGRTCAVVWEGRSAPGAARPDRRLPGRQRAAGRGAGDRDGRGAGGGVRGAARAHDRARADAAGGDPRATARRSSSTTPIRPTRWRPRWRRCARMSWAASSSCSAPAATATRASAR